VRVHLDSNYELLLQAEISQSGMNSHLSVI
jgi:hypothetical protein